MAIVIPSSKTYERQNPKVRDNVIERIEVGAVEIKPNTEYAVVVHTTNDYEEQYEQNVSDFKLIAQYVGAIGNNYQQFAGATGIKAIFRDIYIKIPIVNGNKTISNVFYGKSKNGENQIKSTIQYKKYTGTKQFKISYSANPTSSFGESSSAVNWETYEPYYSNSETGSVDLWSKENEDGYYNPIKYELSIGKDTKKIVSSSIQDITNINSTKITKTQDGNFYEVAIKIWVGGEYYSGSLPNEQVSQGSLAGNSYNFYATAEKIEPIKVEISIYGNTIGIDLQDKTVYINGETAKKVHSVEGNELMQTANYMVDKNGTKAKAIDKMYGDTQTDYAKGKETATIRCSISDYYDGDQKVIAIDNSTGKMSFKMYDQVIPMIYGADRQDHPMSTYQDGSPKVFQVLGSNIYYDGAVWQELSLQEIAKKIEKEPIQPLTAPYLEINGSILKINNTDQRATEFLILVDGNEMAKTTNDSFNLSLLNLPVGSYSITAKSKAFGLENSQESNQVIFVVEEEEPEEPEITKDFEIDNMIVVESDTEENVANVFDEGEPIIEQDEKGNTLFYYDNLALVISSNSKTKPEDLLWLVSGEEIIVYPFDMNSSYYENSLNWIYRLQIKEAKNGAVISYKDINGIEQTIGFNYWNYPPITIEFYIVGGIGTIKVTDKDGDGYTVTNVDFSMGVTILSN